MPDVKSVLQVIDEIDEARLPAENKKIDISVVTETKIDDKVEDLLIAIGGYPLQICGRNRYGAVQHLTYIWLVTSTLFSFLL